jgi:hypothetical protein
MFFRFSAVPDLKYALIRGSLKIPSFASSSFEEPPTA